MSSLNIISVRNKFDLLVDIIKDSIDILMISEIKLDSSFPKRQFTLNHIDLIEMEMVVENCYLSVTIYPQKETIESQMRNISNILPIDVMGECLNIKICQYY